MSRKLPPLNALRALEAAGRHGSFTRAAEELNVTPGAISRQVKLLEDGFGIELFERHSDGLKAVDRCVRYSQALTEIFNRMEVATKQLLSVTPENQLRVSSSMTFNLRWLLPRVVGFHKQHPGWDLRFTAAAPPPSLIDGEDADVFIQLNDGRRTDLFAEPLIANELMPVCSPALLASSGPFRSVADLAGQNFLHSTLRPGHWPTWLAGVGAGVIEGHNDTFFGSSALAYQASIDGLGIAMGQLSFVLGDLKAGRLVPAIPLVVRDADQFHFVWQPDGAPQKVIDFHSWIFAEAASHQAAVDAYVAGLAPV
ncbi:MAG TPA: LysR substrate-binding domain-containing protein [Devosia sp.]|nr:LysR substrate-binding domain-containing protein [Devosia sp.]